MELVADKKFCKKEEQNGHKAILCIDIIKRKSSRWVVHKGRISSPWQPLSTGWNGVIISQTK